MSPGENSCTLRRNCDRHSLWFRRRCALGLIVDIEDVKVKAKENRIKIKVIVDRCKPSAGVVDILVVKIVLKRWQCCDRLTLIRRTEVRIGRRVLFEITAITWRSAKSARWTSPKIVGWKWRWRSVRGIDNARWASDDSGKRNSRGTCTNTNADANTCACDCLHDCCGGSLEVRNSVGNCDRIDLSNG